MLKGLREYENLGTPNFFNELFDQLRNTEKPWTSDDVRSYFYNRIVDGYAVFDGCLPLAEAIEAIIINENGVITLNPSLGLSLGNARYLSNKLLEMILISARQDDVFHDIFCSKNISYDVIYRLIQIEGAAFRFRYASFRNLLVNFNFLYPHPDGNIRKLIVNSRYKKLFDRQIMPEIKRRKVGIMELEKLLEQKQLHGAEAEFFALGYERKRLESHRDFGKIEIISEYDVAAGYDLVSYNNVQSAELDRFIEVKSFSGVPSFHWSRNEMDVARLKRNHYFLYLIDRDKMSDPEYIPIIIENPHENILNLSKANAWNKTVDSYFIIKT